jgi:tyrosine-protein kinase Etk/Wzc
MKMKYSTQEINELPPMNPSISEEHRIGLRSYMNVLVNAKKSILSILLLVVSVTSVYMLLAPRTYKANALLRIDKNMAVLAAALPSESNINLAKTETREILRSRSVLGKVVEDLNLMVEYKPRYFPIIGEALAAKHDHNEGIARPWWGFSGWAWGGERLHIQQFRVPDDYLDQEFGLVALSDTRFQLLDTQDNILAEGQLGELVSADIGESTPVEIQINELVAYPGTKFELKRITSLAAIDNLQKAFSVQDISNDINLLSLELEGSDQEQLAQSVNAIASMYLNTLVNWSSGEASSKLSLLESQLPMVKTNLEKAEQALDVYSQQHGALDFSVETEALLKQAQEMHTLAIQLNQQFQAQNKVLDDTDQIINITKTQIQDTDLKLMDLDKRIKELPKSQQDIIGLSLDVHVKTELYNAILKKAQQQRLAVTASIGNSQIVDFALTPANPYWPKLGLLLTISSLLGLLLGAGWTIFRFTLQNRDNFPVLLEYQTEMPLYAAIPHSKKQQQLARLVISAKDREVDVLVNHDPLDSTVESLRGLCTTLETTLDSDESKVIMLSSPAAGMGKSFISANLAPLLANVKKRVLIIDADLHNGRLHETFAINKQPGLSDLLSGKATLGEVIVSLPELGIDLIPRGNVVLNPADLLVVAAHSESLEQLKSFYNHIVIDSPPVLGVTDALILGKHADATFLVVKEGRYSLQELESSFRRLQLVGIKPSGFIINDMKEGSSFFPFYGYASRRSELKSSNSASWLAGFQSIGDWLSQHDDDSLSELTESSTLEEPVRG